MRDLWFMITTHGHSNTLSLAGVSSCSFLENASSSMRNKNYPTEVSPPKNITIAITGWQVCDTGLRPSSAPDSSFLLKPNHITGTSSTCCFTGCMLTRNLRRIRARTQRQTLPSGCVCVQGVHGDILTATSKNHPTNAVIHKAGDLKYSCQMFTSWSRNFFLFFYKLICRISLLKTQFVVCWNEDVVKNFAECENPANTCRNPQDKCKSCHGLCKGWWRWGLPSGSKYPKCFSTTAPGDLPDYCSNAHALRNTEKACLT